ncbi:flagellar protein FlbD [Tepiditoga spiralis]|uniref:Flagellar protein FlbD n=1 Tax=Tepiditoga spiralis TaxID=2108365 RepID=A0A7G1G6F1_9BACT|nr:flagellar FlbD family protein [Tepiditoga spiralis]BBE32148.1 flagellar protein FlbD [Tepiditoga spiralis]
MIELSKLNNIKFIINCEQIEKIESRPDTTITMMNGHFYVVKESIEEVIEKVIKYKRSFYLQKGD